MNKEIFAGIKKRLAISLIACFVLSMTAVAVVSADKDPNWGPNSQSNYDKAYNKAYSIGESKGKIDGKRDGMADCKNGLENNGGDNTKGHKSTTDTSPQKIGRIDGYNAGYDDGYSTGYGVGYDSCVQNKQQGEGLAAPNP